MAESDNIKIPSNRIRDLTGRVFGRLHVVSYAGQTPTKQSLWLCRCECGNDKIVIASSLGRTTLSCGCYRRDRFIARRTKHGMEATKEYDAWQHAKDRCFNPRNTHYSYYGGRGITVCKEWRDDFAQFFADMGPCPDGDFVLDRIDTNGNYEKGNCRWTDRITQNRNVRRAIFITHEGQTLHIKEWSQRLKIPYLTLYNRLRRGQPLFGPSRYGVFRYKARK
jgi:hypothetical protein